jgi:uncharacterized protein YciW
VLKWVASSAAVVGVGGLLIWAFLSARGEQSQERERERAIAAPQRVTRGTAGEMIVSLDPASRQRIGLQVAGLPPATHRPELVAAGTLQEDPSRTFTLRAPIAGALRVSGSVDWPRLGVPLADGSIVGAIEPRVAPTTKIDLESRLATARSEVSAATAATSAARASFERNKELNAHGKIVADRIVEESEARLKESEARLAAATDQARLVAESLEASTGPTGPIPLRLTRGGEVLEVIAQPGEAVESGQPILKVGRFDSLLARVEIPAGERIDRAITTARVVVLGQEDHPLRGERIALAASDPKTLGQALLFRVPTDGLAVRPGQPITAYLPTSGSSQRGVVVPRSAIVRFAGRTWAYVELGGDRFSRREVAPEHPTAAGWFMATGWSPGDRIVTIGAEVLLSEELKSEIRIPE